MTNWLQRTRKHDEIIYIICTRFCFKASKSCTLACKILYHNCLTDQRWLSGASAYMYHVIFCYTMKHVIMERVLDNKLMTLLLIPSPAPPLVVLPPLSPGGGMTHCSVMTAPTVSLLKYWPTQQQPPTPTHWQWLGNWWRLWVCISVMCPTSGHIQEVPEA